MGDEQFRQTVVSLLECSVCLLLLCDPITISCGHSFCRVCLVKSVRRHKKHCPTCREVCHVSPETALENVILKALAMQVDPALYRQRLLETTTEKEHWTALYPVFVYNHTMLPGNKLSLHLFEPRYRLMMTRIVNSSRAFAYVSSPSGFESGSVALVAELKEAELLEDGRWLLEATLCKRSRIVEHYIEEGTRGLHCCRIEPFHDEAVSEDRQGELQALRQHAVALSEQVLASGHARRIVEEQFGAMPVLDYEQFSMWFASISPLSENEKAALLRSRDTIDRLRSCVQIVEAHLAQRHSARYFPVARAIGAGISSALSALLGSNAGTVGASEQGPSESSTGESPPNTQQSAEETAGSASGSSREQKDEGDA